MMTNYTPLPELDDAFDQLVEFVEQLGREYNFVPWWASVDGADQQAEPQLALEGRAATN